MDLKALLLQNRPTLSEGSLRTYDSVLRSICSRMEMPISMETFTNTEKMFEGVSHCPINSRKTILSALFVLTGEPSYRVEFMKDIETVNKALVEQRRTPKQDENWRSFQQVKELWNESKETASLFWNAEVHNSESLRILQKFVILSLVSGVYIPPRRTLDWTLLKFRNYDRELDNYIENDEFVFNRYKTAKKYGQQRISIPEELLNLLYKWEEIITPLDTDYVLFNDSMNPLSVPLLTQKLNSYFGCRISCSMLRHIYITDVSMKHMPALKYLQDVSYQMGHSLGMHMLYKVESSDSD